MKVLGLIAEYNPFHNGHLIHLEKSLALSGCQKTILVMSGNFVQRGEPAIIDKTRRTEMALKMGVDVVIELPIYYATASAEKFAWGAVSLLEKTGVITDLCFGSEIGDLSEIEAISQFLCNESTDFKQNLKEHLKEGLSFPMAREKALQLAMNTGNIALNSPNNILAIEYLKALKNINSEITPHTIKREAAGYHTREMKGNICSATAIRAAILNEEYNKIRNFMPEACFELLVNELKNGSGHLLNDFSQIFQYILLSKNNEYLKEIEDMTEGLENRMVNQLKTTFTINDMIPNIKTKRYTFTKIQRAILHTILGIEKKEMAFYNSIGGCCYLRVLGFRRESSFLLKEIERRGSLPLITNLKNAENILNKHAMKMLEKEIETTDIYYCFDKKNRKKFYEYSQPLVII